MNASLFTFFSGCYLFVCSNKYTLPHLSFHSPLQFVWESFFFFWLLLLSSLTSHSNSCSSSSISSSRSKSILKHFIRAWEMIIRNYEWWIFSWRERESNSAQVFWSKFQHECVHVYVWTSIINVIMKKCSLETTNHILYPLPPPTHMSVYSMRLK